MGKPTGFKEFDRELPSRRPVAERIKDFFIDNGWDLTGKLREADIIVFGTCGATNRSEEHCIRSLKKINKRKKSDCQVVITGCLPAINSERLKNSGIICCRNL